MMTLDNHCVKDQLCHSPIPSNDCASQEEGSNSFVENTILIQTFESVAFHIKKKTFKD